VVTAAGTARALWFPAPRTVELREEPLPPTGAGRIRVRALASGISHGTEMLVFRGEVRPDLQLDLPTLAGAFSFPVKYGYASVGRVVETGTGVEAPAVGDLVFVHHPHQSEYVVAADAAIGLPEGIDPVTGVFLANLETAVNVALDAHPHLGDRVVVIGQGVVGLLIGLVLRRTGTALLVTVDPVPQRRALAGELGADAVLAPGPDLTHTVRDLTGGTGADLVVEASGVPAALDSAIGCAGFQGTIVVCSWYGTKPVCVELGGDFHRGRLRIVSSQVGAVDPALAPRWSITRRRALACELLTALPLGRLVTHGFPLERAGEAYHLVDAGAPDAVQVVLTYRGDRV
jgi:2-desacetyl-2-hydroxyethyl bacteriochlorophyllide A dehydrogenase